MDFGHQKYNLAHIVLLILLLGCNPIPDSEIADAPPNVIFIMSDDQGYADLGCYGSDFVKTPNIDQLAAEGIRFTQAYAGSPVCAPTRCSLMTGKHSGHITRRGNRSTDDLELSFRSRKLIPLNDADFTIGEMFQEANYHTGAIGKWGLGNMGTSGEPNRQGFDYFYGYVDQVHAHNYYTDYLIKNQDTIPIPGNKGDQKQVYTHDILAEDALDFVRRNQKEPFFLYLPYTPPHSDYVVPDNSQYRDQEWPEKVQNYAAMISRMDQDIGELMDLLKELGLDENTLVFFTSDHGPNPPFVKSIQSNKPFRGTKRQLLEGGLRVPMIARWPGKIPSGQVSEFVWSFWDVLPTLADLIGYEGLIETDGQSVMPTLLGQNQDPAPYQYWEFYDPFQQAVRLDDWKGIRVGTEESLHLFDLSEDLNESDNVADQHPEVVSRIEEIMAEEHEDSPNWPVVKKGSPRAQAILTKF